jgi:hypothetical protein
MLEAGKGEARPQLQECISPLEALVVVFVDVFRTFMLALSPPLGKVRAILSLWLPPSDISTRVIVTKGSRRNIKATELEARHDLFNCELVPSRLHRVTVP